MHYVYASRLIIAPGALNWATGETVAIKEIQLSNIPKGEIRQIMVRDRVHFAYARAQSLPSQKSIYSRISMCDFATIVTIPHF